MIRRTHGDVRGSGQLLPEMRGRRHALYGVEVGIEDGQPVGRNLAPEHSFGNPLKSYAYGTSKKSLRPGVPGGSEAFLETPPVKAKRKPRKAPVRQPRKPRKAPAPKPVSLKPVPLKPRMRVIQPVVSAPEVRRERIKNRDIYPAYSPPKPKPPRNIYGSGPDPRLTGEDVDDMLAEFG